MTPGCPGVNTYPASFYDWFSAAHATMTAVVQRNRASMTATVRPVLAVIRR